MFAILVLMALFTTFMTTPTVMAIYKPLRSVTSPAERQTALAWKKHHEFRILACIHGPENVPALINLTELIRTSNKSPLKLYVMQLVELTDRSSSIVMVQKTRRNGVPFTNRFRQGMLHDQVHAAFETYNQLGRVTIRHSTAISSLSTMHEDIFHVAEKKKVGIIILPFHKQQGDNGQEAVDSISHGWREVNQTVLQIAPCSVAVLVDRGFGYGSETMAESGSVIPKMVCIVFFGGAHDRKAIELGGRIAEHTAIKVTLLRFLSSQDTSIEDGISSSRANINYLREKELDEITVEKFMKKSNGTVEYNEMVMSNSGVELLKIAQSNEYELIVVGKSKFSSTMEAKFAEYRAENAELGAIGNILASSDLGVSSSVLMIQQQDTDDSNETTVSKMITVDNATIACV